ncbi:MAG: NAD(P)-dependent alcohol dehydrogenase [Acidobacteria bacterium]|nr:MAG: NAD(P)-dependent alcohol dehydrogenase [Acidobacteriota bacterium]
MQAIVYRTYGSPDVLRCEEIERPVPASDEVLIRVHAASVNPFDWHFMRGEPYLFRLMTGLGKPKNPRLGADVAGTVEAVGKDVTRLRAGDEVFGAGRGSFAEYVCAPVSRLAVKPERVSFEQAAAVPIAALTALQALRDKGHVRSGHAVLVNGAAGGVGTFAVQIAKAFGARVTGVCSTRNLELVRGIGADDVIDYAREDLTTRAERYDIVLDLVGNRSLRAWRRVLKPNGTYVGAAGTTDPWMIGPLVQMMAAPVLSLFGSRKLVSLLASINTDDLALVVDLVASGKVTPVIDRRYPLREVPEAIRYLEAGHARGKVIIVRG